MSSWYSRYYGDYMRDTGHLSLEEHGAYTILLDHYYATKKALPSETPALFRICRAFTDSERASVTSVLGQFFPVGADGNRHNARADKELNKEEAISRSRADAGSKGANGKWYGKRHGKPMANAINQDGKTMALATTTTTTSTIPPAQPPPPSKSTGGGVTEPIVHTPPIPVESLDSKLVQLAQKIRGCRPEYGVLQVYGIAHTLNAYKDDPRLEWMVGEWCIDHANSMTPFNNPLASLRKNLQENLAQRSTRVREFGT